MHRLLPLSPLRHGTFRWLWAGWLVSNLGTMVQSMGAAWLMASIVTSSGMVALVQAATTLPVMLLSIPSGALADIFERRRLLLVAQVLMKAAALAMAGAVMTGLMGPWLLLGLTFLMGCGTALHTPSWQASVGDVVPREDIPAAVTLNGMGLNLTRSTGPAIGGLIVAAAGPAAAFAVNALSYIPMIFGLTRLPRPAQPKALPGEDFGRAILTGLRYAAMSPSLMRIIGRGFLFGTAAVAVLALLPLVARDLLQGGAVTYGLLLGAFGLGAMGGGLANQPLRQRFSAETIIRGSFAGLALCCAAIAFSGNAVLTAVLLLPAGGSWVLALSLFHVAVQLSTPRWVVGRVLALYQTAAFGGQTLGGWIAERDGLQLALLSASGAAVIGGLWGLRFAMPVLQSPDLAPRNVFAAPDVQLDITPRSGPIRVLVEYDVPLENDDAFFAVMAERRRVKIRDGAIQWVLLRDVEAPMLWKESYTFPTWSEYLRSNQRPTQADADISERLRRLTRDQKKPTVRRMIERHSMTALDPLTIKPDPQVH